MYNLLLTYIYMNTAEAPNVYDVLTPEHKRLLAEAQLQMLVQANVGKSLDSLATEIRSNTQLAMLDSDLVTTAANTIQTGADAYGYTTVQNLGNGALGMNEVGTNKAVVDAQLVMQAIYTDASTLKQVVIHENAGHGAQSKDVQDVVLTNGEIMSSWEVYEGHAEHVSNPNARRSGQPEDYRNAQDKFETNNTAALTAYATTGNRSAAQAALFTETNTSAEEQIELMQSANFTAPEISEVIKITRAEFEMGPNSARAQSKQLSNTRHLAI